MNDARNTLASLRIDREDSPEARSGRRRWLLGLVALLLVLGAAGYWTQRSHEVRTATARGADGAGSRALLHASGYVTARREATVSSKVTGKVVEVLVEEGMQVEAGQILARLDDTNSQAAWRLAEAQLEAARAARAETEVRLGEARREEGRQAALVAERVATEADLDRAQSEVKSLVARLEKQAQDIRVAERELELRQQELEDLLIRAPFSGIVTVKSAQPGEMISPISAGGGFTRTGICTVVDMTSLEVEVDVNESFINRITPGQSVESALDAYPDWKLPSQVIAIIPTADRQKSTVKVRIGLAQLDPRILPEMAVRVAFLGEETGSTEAGGGVWVPQAAVHKDAAGAYVWRVQDGRVSRRGVRAGETRNEEVLVASGLAAGDQVVVDGAGRLRDGARVREARR